MGFLKEPLEGQGGQVTFSKLASRDSALFTLPEGRLDALGMGNYYLSRLPEPCES